MGSTSKGPDNDTFVTYIYSAATLFIFVGIAVVALTVWNFRSASSNGERDGDDQSAQEPEEDEYLTGIFRYSRNPIRVGYLVVILAVGIGANMVWLAAMIVPAFFVTNWFIAASEEPFLESKLGQEYLDYKAAVRRWL